jgi:MATE family multidrug resistance protein
MASSILREIRSIALLALPLVVGMFISVSTGIIDTSFAGALGEIPLAAASLTTSVLILFYSVLYGLTNPVSVFVGTAYGAGDNAKIADVLRHALPIAWVSGTIGALMMMALYYLLPLLGQPEPVVRAMQGYWFCMSAMLLPFTVKLAFKQCLDAMERAWTSSALQLITPLSNLLYAYALVFWCDLGLLGIGMASVLASFTGLGGIYGYFRYAPSLQSVRHAMPTSRQSYREQLREGIPIATQYLMEGGGVAVAGVMIGLFGATALAANQIVLSVAGFLYMLPLGLASAVSIRIAQAVGRGAAQDLRLIGFTGMGMVTLWMIGFTVLFVFVAAPIAALFTNDAAIIATAVTLFWVVGLMQIGDGIQSVAVGCLRGLLDNDWPMLVSIIAYWLIALPIAYVFGFVLHWGAAGIWAGFGVGLFLASIALIGRFLHMTRRAPAISK